LTLSAKFFVGAIVVAICAAAGVWGAQVLLSDDEASGNGQGGAPQAVRVTTATAERREIEDRAGAVGTIQPLRSVKLRPEATGRVTARPVRSGAKVEAGDLIVQLDPRAARAALAEAQATLDETRRDFRRFEELKDENVAAKARLDEARAAFDRAKANMTRAEVELEKRAIRAPFAGVLGIVDIDVGDYIDQGTIVGQLDDLSDVEAAFALPESYFSTVSPGLTVRARSAVYPDAVFEGEVSVRAPRISEDTRSFDVRARFDNAEQRLVGGMFVRLEIVFATFEAPEVPDEAIITEGRDSYVFKIENGTARRTPIEPGPSREGRTAIERGLKPGAEVVVSGWNALSDGADVEILSDQGEAAQ